MEAVDLSFGMVTAKQRLFDSMPPHPSRLVEAFVMTMRWTTRMTNSTT